MPNPYIFHLLCPVKSCYSNCEEKLFLCTEISWLTRVLFRSVLPPDIIVPDKFLDTSTCGASFIVVIADIVDISNTCSTNV